MSRCPERVTTVDFVRQMFEFDEVTPVQMLGGH